MSERFILEVHTRYIKLKLTDLDLHVVASPVFGTVWIRCLHFMELILALTDLLGHWQPGCAEHFPREEIAGAQLVQIKVCSFLSSFIVSVSETETETLYFPFGRCLKCLLECMTYASEV